MSVVANVARLRYEMARRGWSAADLARESRLSNATVGAALTARPVTAHSLALIAEALLRVPAVGGIDSLIDGGGAELDN